MTTTTPEPASGLLAPVAEALFTVNERQALAGCLAGYNGLTRDAYILDLRQYTTGAPCTACTCSPRSGRHRVLPRRHGSRRPRPRLFRCTDQTPDEQPAIGSPVAWRSRAG
jgi:hypothetical protein